MEIKEEGILEFKGLTMTKRVFKQLRQVSGERVELVGWVNDEGFEYFVGKLGNKLVAVARRDMWDRFARERKELEAEAQKMGVGLTMLINIKLDELRDGLPQIFLK